MAKAKYNQMSDDEKYKLFTGHELSFLKIENKNDLDFYIREKNGYDIIEKFLITEGGIEMISSESFKKYTLKPKIGAEIPVGHVYYDSKYNYGIILETKQIPCSSSFAFSEDKWYYNTHYRNLSIKNSKSINCLTNTEIKVTRLIKEEKSFWGKKIHTESVSLYPFIDNIINEELGQWENRWIVNTVEKSEYEKSIMIKKKFNNRPLNFWTFIEKAKFEDYLLNDGEIEILKKLYLVLDNYVNDAYEQYISIPNKEKQKEKSNVKSKIKKIIKEESNKGDNSFVEILNGDNIIMDLLENNENAIVSVDINIVKDLIKLSAFLNNKKENLSKLYNLFKSTENENEFNAYLSVFNIAVQNYNLLLIHSINMIVSLKDKKMIAYFELYEFFDKLGVFDSNWESELTKKLENVEYKLSDLINSLDSLDYSISENLERLNYTTKLSYEELQTSMTQELKLIRKGVGLNNLLQGISAYQLYKIGKQKP